MYVLEKCKAVEFVLKEREQSENWKSWEEQSWEGKKWLKITDSDSRGELEDMGKVKKWFIKWNLWHQDGFGRQKYINSKIIEEVRIESKRFRMLGQVKPWREYE